MTSSEIKERPILFSGPMVQAILNGKTQTRRIVNPKRWNIPAIDCCEGHPEHPVWQHMLDNCPYGQPGERLWVRERCIIGRAGNDRQIIAVFPTADGWDMGSEHSMHPEAPEGSINWCLEWKRTPSIHMPRWASRITLEVVSVRVERIQEIDDEDIQSEGFTDSYSTPTCIATAECYGMSVPRHRFSCLWEKINGGGSWGANPWVWVVEFKRI